MKYCSKCGHELLDEAIICVHCGCMIENHGKKNKKSTSDVNSNCPSKAVFILSFIYWCIIIIASVLVGAALANGGGQFYCRDYVSYNSVVCKGNIAFVSENDTAIAAEVFSSISFVMAIINVVCACVGSHEFKEKLFSVLKIIISLGFIILTGIMIG